MDEQQFCPCGRGSAFVNCCGRYINQLESAPTAEALMRSRYSAFVLNNESYVLESWHRSSRPAQLELDSGESVQWLSLDIVSISTGNTNDNHGTVEFIAAYKHNGRVESLHETSRFIKEEGRWYYLDGKTHAAKNNANKIGRNTPCPCGSEKKYKRCCGC